MSAENSRLVRSIRRIAQERADQSGSIYPGKPRGDQPGGVGVGESDGERDRICCDGSTSGDANPGTDTRDTSDGGQGGLDPSDPANLDANGQGEMSGVVDCATGEPVCFDGGGFIPPEEWDDPGSPPDDPTYAPGFFWLSGGINAVGGCAFQCCSAAPTQSLAISRAIACAGEAWTQCTQQLPCGASTCRDSQPAPCDPPESETKAPSWPSDDCVNLAIVDGAIVGSKYDPENDGSYSAPRDEIDLCDLETGDSILIRPSADGGWKSIKSLDGDIDPDTGAGYLYRPNGSRVRQISPSEFRDDTV